MLLCRTRHQLGHHPTIMQLACRLLDVQALPKVEAYISVLFLKKQQNELVNRCHGKSPSVGRVRVKFESNQCTLALTSSQISFESSTLLYLCVLE
jgi:hypothetical protein